MKGKNIESSRHRERLQNESSSVQLFDHLDGWRPGFVDATRHCHIDNELVSRQAEKLRGEENGTRRIFNRAPRARTCIPRSSPKTSATIAARAIGKSHGQRQKTS